MRESNPIDEHNMNEYMFNYSPALKIDRASNQKYYVTGVVFRFHSVLHKLTGTKQYQCASVAQWCKLPLCAVARCRFVVRPWLMEDPLSLFSFQPVRHDWCNKDRGICYPVSGMVQIKEALLLFGKSSLCGGSGFPLLLSEWFFTICPTPYNRK